MPISPPVQITVPFATSGLKNAIPANTNNVTGNAGYNAGFGAINMTPKTAGGIPPFGQDFNGIFYDVTLAIQFMEAGGSFPYSSAFATAVGGYPLGALVSRTDGAGLWRNTVANNTTDPETFGAGWQPEDAGATAIVMTNANVTLTALQAARSIITITGVLTANLNLIFPTYRKQWLIVNNCTGAFSVTCKTAAGSGFAVGAGTNQSVYGDSVNINSTYSNGAFAPAQCRLSKSGANLLLSRFNGNGIIINGISQSIPVAGVTLAPAGLTPSTLYYIYAFMNSGVMTLEASVTGHGTDATTGVEIKTGDATRTLVGMVRPITGPAFIDSSVQRFVASWFNRIGKDVWIQQVSTASTASSTNVILTSSLTCEFLTWADEVVLASAEGPMRVTNNSATIITYITFNGFLSGDADGLSTQPTVINFDGPLSLTLYKTGLSEGYNTSTILGNTSAGTATWGATKPWYNRILIQG